jgi:predicted transcriptional regulator
MLIAKIAELLECEVFVKSTNFDQEEIDHVIAGDLMSEVLVVDEEGLLLITCLTSDQVVRTADIVDAHCILLVNGKSPQNSMKSLAEQFDVSILSTKLPLFEACHKIGTALEA